MSGIALEAVWHLSQSKGTDKLVLCALAHLADECGVVFLRNMQPLIDETGFTDRGIRNILERLRGLGEVRWKRDAGGPGNHRFEVCLPVFNEIRAAEARKKEAVTDPESIERRSMDDAQLNDVQSDEADSRMNGKPGLNDVQSPPSNWVSPIPPSPVLTVPVLSGCPPIGGQPERPTASGQEPSGILGGGVGEPVFEDSSTTDVLSAGLDPVDIAWRAYRQKIKPKARAFPKGKIEARLKQFSLKEVIDAIDHFSKDHWWMQNNGHRSAEWFFRSDGQIEQFLHMQPRASPNGTSHRSPPANLLAAPIDDDPTSLRRARERAEAAVRARYEKG